MLCFLEFISEVFQNELPGRSNIRGDNGQYFSFICFYIFKIFPKQILILEGESDNWGQSGCSVEAVENQRQMYEFSKGPGVRYYTLIVIRIKITAVNAMHSHFFLFERNTCIL